MSQIDGIAHQATTIDLSIYQEDLLRCIQCGNCSGICPLGFAMEYPPSRIISAVRAGIFSRVTATESAWLCIACSACTTACPALIPITENLMMKTKEELVLLGHVPSELQSAFENSQRYGNPMGESPRKRGDWVDSLEFTVPVLSREFPETDVLWFVGDYGSYHPVVTPATVAFARILHLLGINFGILGNQESSDGDSQRLAGERGLFEILAEKNARAFNKYKFNQIVTTDPHAFNALKNAYPEMGITFPVKHYSQFLYEKMEMIQPLIKNEINAKVTFHDPCYLGRVNGVYEEPRALIQSIKGIELVEMHHHHQNSLCCGGGGGGMWLDGFHWEQSHIRSSEWRIQEAVDAGADILIVACPYEKPRFLDAVKNVAGAGKLQVLDLSELLLRCIE